MQDRLLEAVRACDLEAIRACAQAGANLSGPVGGRTPPLHCAAMQPSRAAAIPMLIELGADINGYDAEGVTAVSIAAFSGNVLAIRLLASGGADVNAVDGRGSHPLHRAVSTNRIDVVEALAAAGADVNARAGIFSGLYLACLRNNVPMVRLLIRLGADCNGSNSFKNFRIVLSPLSVVGIDLLEAMVEAGLDLTTRVADGPPLHYAAEHGNQAAVRWLCTAMREQNISLYTLDTVILCIACSHYVPP